MRKKIWFGAAWCWTFLMALLCLADFNKFPSVPVAGGDKYGHFIFHFVFTALWFAYFDSKAQKGNILKMLLRILLLSLCFGIALEIAQHLFTTTRKADVLDVAANFSGALAAIILILAWKKRLNSTNLNK